MNEPTVMCAHPSPSCPAVFGVVQWLRQSHPSSTLLWMMRDVAEQLRHLHEAGYTHRDIKPGNAVLLRSLSWRLLDLGFAARSGALMISALRRDVVRSWLAMSLQAACTAAYV